MFTTNTFMMTNSLVLNQMSVRPKKRNCLFPVMVRKKNRVGRLVKNFFFALFFGQKCVFYAGFL